MSQNKAKFIPLSDKKGPVFGGGVVDNLSPNKLYYYNSPYARNFRLTDGGISIRPGFYQYGDDLSASDYPRGIGAYLRSATADDRIIIRHNVDATHKIVSIVPSTGDQTSIDTTGLITSDNRMNFLSANDSIYCYNGIDLIGKLSGTTYTNPVATIAPGFGVWFNNSAWVGGDLSSPNTLYKSNTNDPETYTGTGGDIFTSTTPIIGLCASLETLYIFSESYIDMISSSSIQDVGGTLVYISAPLESMEGAMGHNTIINYGKSAYFLSRSGKIKRVTPGNSTFDVVEVSHREDRGVSKIMDTLDSDQTDGFAYIIPEKQLIKWHLKTKGSDFNDICIIYNPEDDEFMIDDHKVFYGGINYKTQNFTISQIEPKIYKDEFGKTDDDSPIQFRYDTKHMNFGNPTMNKLLRQLRTYLGINKLGKVYQNVYADGSLVDSKLIDSSTIPQAMDGLGTESVGTFAIGTEGATIDSTDKLYNTTIVRDKGYLRIKAKHFYVSYVAYELGTQLLLQNLMPQIESLPFLDTPHY